MKKQTPKYTTVLGTTHLLRIGGKGRAVAWCGIKPEPSKGDTLTAKPPKGAKRCSKCFGGAL